MAENAAAHLTCRAVHPMLGIAIDIVRRRQAHISGNDLEMRTAVCGRRPGLEAGPLLLPPLQEGYQIRVHMLSFGLRTKARIMSTTCWRSWS